MAKQKCEENFTRDTFSFISTDTSREIVSVKKEAGQPYEQFDRYEYVKSKKLFKTTYAYKTNQGEFFAYDVNGTSFGGYSYDFSRHQDENGIFDDLEVKIPVWGCTPPFGVQASFTKIIYSQSVGRKDGFFFDDSLRLGNKVFYNVYHGTELLYPYTNEVWITKNEGVVAFNVFNKGLFVIQ